eukprot:Hpha_TRINITY_DN16342_c3_g1::TRINITY_DN16342_c3_g1_i5::g.58405::m.58405/K07359/CAMKK2; calcium/calmodulin-dependent protein kinase kinase 2
MGPPPTSPPPRYRFGGSPRMVRSSSQQGSPGHGSRSGSAPHINVASPHMLHMMMGSGSSSNLMSTQMVPPSPHMLPGLHPGTASPTSMATPRVGLSTPGMASTPQLLASPKAFELLPSLRARRPSFSVEGLKTVFESDELNVWEDQTGELALLEVQELGRVFHIVKKLGEGATSEVFEVVDTEGATFAVKIVHCEAHAKAEASSLRRLQHKNVVRFEGKVSAPDHPLVYLFFEFVGGGPICELTPYGELVGKPWAEEDARRAMIDLVAAVAHLHQHNVVHRDIKPENCLVRETGEVVLCDFGASSRPKNGDDSTRKTVGTPFFQPPEACTGRRFPTKGQDAWALGVTLYVLIFGRVPFGCGARNVLELSKSLAEGTLDLDDPFVTITPECKEFLRQLLEKDLTQRMGVGEMVRHPWLARRPCTQPLPTPRCRQQSVSPLHSRSDSVWSFSRKTSLNSGDRLVPVLVQLSHKRAFSPAFWGVKTVRTFPPREEVGSTAEGSDEMRVLIVDDDHTTRSHLGRRLSAVTEVGSKQQTIYECANGDIALQEVLTGNYAAVFIRMHMVSCSAMDFAQAVRKAGMEKPCVLVAMTRKPGEQREAALNSGLDDLVNLPPRMTMLRRHLDAIGWTTKARVNREQIYQPDSAYDVMCRDIDDRRPSRNSRRRGSLFAVSSPRRMTESRSTSISSGASTSASPCGSPTSTSTTDSVPFEFTSPVPSPPPSRSPSRTSRPQVMRAHASRSSDSPRPSFPYL